MDTTLPPAPHQQPFEQSPATNQIHELQRPHQYNTRYSIQNMEHVQLLILIQEKHYNTNSSYKNQNK